ncbi:hypothetical protein [Pseudomonas sp. PP3]|uniref:hypothetical protein n=1 Tax=Pseudomonas sp. PP3 TaxID=2815936 RepID=UPI001BAE94E9|nr:hypothetical protein [Pseudomonas sp. PP3]
MTGYLETIPHPWTRQHIQKAMTSNFQTVQKSIDQTEGGRLWRGINELDEAIWVFSKSTVELIDEISVFSERSKDIEFWSKTNEKNAEEYVREVKRRLYYSTSSLMTVVDIARAFSTKWPVDGLVEHRNKFFSTPGLHDFLQNLRNFSSHWRIAEANWQINYDFQTGLRVASFRVSEEELLAWDGWSAKAKTYIKDASGSVDVFQIFAQYKKHVQEYYRWHKGALLDTYSSILRPYFEYTRIHEGLRQMLKWNMILSHFKPDMNPYQYLAQYLSSKQIELVLSYEHRSEQQVDALIKILDMEDFCDAQLRRKAMHAFGALIDPD